MLIGVGCQAPTPIVSVPPAVNDLQSQPIPESSKQTIVTTSPIVPIVHANTTPISRLISNGTLLYIGAYFDIEYPKEFRATPSSSNPFYNGDKYEQIDEARFISPDESVEFFIFSPSWGGDPANYLTVAPTEHIVSDIIREDDGKGGRYDKKIIRWATLQSNDGSYYRSYISIKEQVGTGDDLHHVFGIKYASNEVYNQYRDAFIAFKKSLHQYGD